MIEFDSMNPYQSLEVLLAESPQELVLMLHKIKTPIKILNFVQVGSRAAVYIMGDHRIKKGAKKDGYSNRSGT